MAVLEYLEQEKAYYRLTEHEPVYTARQLARVEKVQPEQVAKTVVVQADGKYCICVLPADRVIDLDALCECLGAKNTELASEAEMVGLFGDCEVGAEPPLGAHYNLPVLMDESLSRDKQIVFLAGAHTRSIWMDMDEYLHLVKPRIEHFAFTLSRDPGIDWPGMNSFWQDPFAF
jgi:Ala-tRNA(Pro) deacylase